MPQPKPKPKDQVEHRVANNDPLIDALIWVESKGNPSARSPAGAIGAAQAMPETARDPGYGVAPLRDPTNPHESRRFAADYMTAMIKEFRNLDHALMAYNWGPGNVKKWIAGGKTGDIPLETKQYPSRVKGRMLSNLLEASAFENEKRVMRGILEGGGRTPINR